MAFQTKSDIPENRYFEANLYATLATKRGRTDTGFFNEVNPDTGDVYTGNGGEDELLQQLETVLAVNNIRATDWNNLLTEINSAVETNIGELKQDVLEIKAKLEQNDILDFVNETGYGALYTFEDSEGLDTTATTATIVESERVARFSNPTTYTALSDGTFVATRDITIKESENIPLVGDRLNSTNAIQSITANSTVNNNYKSVLHFDGLDESKSFPDEVTRIWYPSGNAEIDTEFKKFGTGSLLLDGSASYIYTFDQSPFNLGSSDFTIDFWMRPTVFSQARAIFGKATIGTDGWYLALNASNQLQFTFRRSGSTDRTITSLAIPTDANFHHIAISRSGSNFYIFIDGTQSANITEALAIDDSAVPMCIGRRRTSDTSTPSFNGRLDDFRFVVGEALYTSNFTPPTRAVSKTTSTYDINLTLPVSTTDNQSLTFLETDQVLSIQDRTFSENFADVALRMYTKNGTPTMLSDDAVSNSNSFIALSKQQQLTADNSFVLNGTNIDISTSSSVGDIDRGDTGQTVSNTNRDIERFNNGRTCVVDSFGSFYYTEYDGSFVYVYRQTLANQKRLIYTTEAIGSVGVWSLALASDDDLFLLVSDYKDDLGNQLVTLIHMDLATYNDTLYVVTDQLGGIGNTLASLAFNKDGTKFIGAIKGGTTSYPDIDNVVEFTGTFNKRSKAVTTTGIRNITTSSTLTIYRIQASYMENDQPIVAMTVNQASADKLSVNYYNGTSWLTTNDGVGTIVSSDVDSISPVTITSMFSEISTALNASYTNGLITIGCVNNTNDRFSSFISTNLGVSWSNNGASGSEVTTDTGFDVSVMHDNFGNRYYNYITSGRIKQVVQDTSLSFGSPTFISSSSITVQRLACADTVHRITDVPMYAEISDSTVRLFGDYEATNAYNITTASNVTLTNRQSSLLGGVYSATANSQSMDLTRITEEFYLFEKTVTEGTTLELETTGKGIDLDLMTYSVG